MLEVKDLAVSYGNIPALRGVSLQVREREVVALIGSNGAGKSTLIKAISGLVPASSGDVLIDGRSVLKRPAHTRAREGIGVVPENRRLFRDMSVSDNLLLGSFSRSSWGRASDVRVDLAWVLELFPRLAERRAQLAGTMSGGEQQMLAIARALMSRPRLIMMDEPSIGLAPRIVREIFGVIGTLRQRGCAILLVEQNAAASLKIADRAYVLELGRITLKGTGAELSGIEQVQSLYLGGALPTSIG